MKKTTLTVLLLFFAIFSVCQASRVEATYKMPKHPRLLMLKGEEKQLLETIKKDSLLQALHQSMLEVADNQVQQPLLKREVIGRRLLHISREALSKLFHLSYAYRTTSNKKYLKKAEEELVNLSQFEDWHPSHFLDVEEMTMGVAIAYDWLYSKLSSKTRKLVEDAIITKGIDPSIGKENKGRAWFITSRNNWNQVCHGGVSYGALATWEKCPEKAAMIINRAIENLPIAMKQYGPDGAYPEGPGYWDYGTSFNVMFLSAIETIFHQDFGLTQISGFMKTGAYITQVTTPSLGSFCYSDNGYGSYPWPAAFWFYQKTNDPSILYVQQRILRQKGVKSLSPTRLAPATLIWLSRSNLLNASAPQTLAYKADGPNPVCIMRSGWNYDDTFLGVKLGFAAENHGHMDVGSFFFESDGVRWATDLGMEDYNTLEVNGLDIWNMKQNSQRWDIFRYNNFVHNTLTLNGMKHNVKGKAEIDSSSKISFPGYVISDLTKVFEGQVKSAKRAFSLLDKDHAVIEDRLETLPGKDLQVTWTMVTAAKPTILSAQTIKLSAKDKNLYLHVEKPADIHMEFQPATPTRAFENQNKGMTIIKLNTTLKAQQPGNIIVKLSKDNKGFSYNSPLK